MKIRIQWEFDLSSEVVYEGAHDEFAFDNGVPLEVDLGEFFDNPREVCEDRITDALSDEYGWLVNSWEEVL